MTVKINNKNDWKFCINSDLNGMKYNNKLKK